MPDSQVEEVSSNLHASGDLAAVVTMAYMTSPLVTKEVIIVDLQLYG